MGRRRPSRLRAVWKLGLTAMHQRGEDRHVLHGRSRWRRAGWATLLMGSMVWLGSVGNAAADTKTWVGGSGSWHTPENWSPVGVPSPTDDAVIAAGTPSVCGDGRRR